MTMGFQRNSASKESLDGKLCFELWARTGSVYKAPLVLANEYHLHNSKLGKPYSHQAVWLAANRYILSSPNEARVLWNGILKVNGVLPTDELWSAFVGSKAKRLPKKRKDEYLEANPHLVDYA